MLLVSGNVARRTGGNLYDLRMERACRRAGVPEFRQDAPNPASFNRFGGSVSKSKADRDQVPGFRQPSVSRMRRPRNS